MGFFHIAIVGEGVGRIGFITVGLSCTTENLVPRCSFGRKNAYFVTLISVKTDFFFIFQRVAI